MAILLAVIAGLLPVHAWGATATTTFTVSANVVSVCVVAAQSLSFGNYSPVSGTDLDATTTVTVTCTLSTPYTVGLDNGTNASGSQRRMALLTTFLNYHLYSDSSRTQRWGNAGAELVSGTGNGLAQNLTAYGRIPPARWWGLEPSLTSLPSRSPSSPDHCSRSFWHRGPAWAWLALILSFVSAAARSEAGGYTVEPVHIFLSAARPSVLLSVQNAGEDSLRLQLTAFAWDQSPRRDHAAFAHVRCPLLSQAARPFRRRAAANSGRGDGASGPG
jgi:spore coat protein U-like protein